MIFMSVPELSELFDAKAKNNTSLEGLFSAISNSLNITVLESVLVGFSVAVINTMNYNNNLGEERDFISAHIFTLQPII